jgi:hypothetical protein
MFNTPQLFQTEPLGNPVGDVGILFILRQFTYVVQSVDVFIFVPKINE